MTQYDDTNITQSVIASLDNCPDTRFKQVMTALISHLHGFIREVDLTEQE